MADEEDPRKSGRRPNPLVRVGGMVFQMLTVILLSAWGGSRLDAHYGTEKPYWTLGCGFAGVILSMAIVIIDAKRPK